MTRDTTRRKPAFAVIADTLGETERAPRGKLRAIVAALCDEAAPYALSLPTLQHPNAQSSNRLISSSS
jgi:hypothetical protein